MADGHLEPTLTPPADNGSGPSDRHMLAAHCGERPMAELVEHPRNPRRRGSLEVIKESLNRNGQYTPITVNKRTRHVLRGNHTLRAARELGWNTISVYLIDIPEADEIPIVLVDNRSSDLATYDFPGLADLLAEVDELAGTGFEQADLKALLSELSDNTPLLEDEVPALPVEPRTKLGDLIALGRHRLICGDASDLETLSRLHGNRSSNLLITDPPFGIDYAGKTDARLKIANDNEAQLTTLLRRAFAAVDPVLLPGSAFYAFHMSGSAGRPLEQALAERGWKPRQQLIWAKDAFVLGHGDYHQRHEEISYGCKAGSRRFGRGGQSWYGGNDQSTVLEVPRPRASRSHPTTKPTELLAIFITNSSRPGEIVLDPFAGSGSLLIACHQLGRDARLVELDPRYCDVIIERFERLTGIAAKSVQA